MTQAALSSLPVSSLIRSNQYTFKISIDGALMFDQKKTKCLIKKFVGDNTAKTLSFCHQ